MALGVPNLGVPYVFLGKPVSIAPMRMLSQSLRAGNCAEQAAGKKNGGAIKTFTDQQREICRSANRKLQIRQEKTAAPQRKSPAKRGRAESTFRRVEETKVGSPCDR